MNGLDFNIRVLKPWARDPAYYTSIWLEQSDTPAHEGPTHHALIAVWTYDFPLNAEAEAKLTAELTTVPPLLAQARDNLVGNARELWVAGITNLRDQAAALEDLERRQFMLYRNICDETGTVRRHLNVFVNADNVRDLDGIDTALTTGDVLTILPAVSGG
jgi:molybdopterin converting factor small subunit